MAQDIAELGLRVRSDGVVTATKRLRDMEQAAGRSTKASERLSHRMRTVGANLARVAAVGGAAMAAMAANSVRLAVAAEETANKFRVVFRGSVEETNAALVEMSRTIPLTVSQMQGLAAGVQDMIVPLGIARDEAAGLSVQAVQLAADIGSFNNVGADQVLQDIQSALAGSSEPLRKYGIDVREAALANVALEEGIIESARAMTQAERAQAVFAAVTRDSADAMGDAARTAGSTANLMRFLQRDIRQAQEDLGTALIPAFQALLQILQTTNSDGLTPIQAAFNGTSKAILAVTRVVMLNVQAWMIVTHEIRQAKEALIDLATNPTIAAGIDLISAAFNPAAAGLAGAVANNQAAAETARNQAQQRAEQERKRFEADMAAMNNLVMGLEQSMDNLGSAASRAMSEASGGVSEVSDTIRGEVIPAIREMDSAISNELAESFAFLDEEGRLRGLSEDIADLRDELFPAEKAMRELAEARQLVNEAFEADLISQQDADRMLQALEDMRQATLGIGDAMEIVGSSISDAIRAIQMGVERGSDEYKRLEVAANAANVVAAIGAVLNQGQGDPYTAFARMAAMATTVASLGYSVGNLSGGAADPTAARQASQGTGTVLGDSEAKSESIVNSLEIVADATSELVGINRGMLRALTNLSDAISGASNILAGQNIEFGALPVPDNIFADLEKIFLGVSFLAESFLGGSVDIADTGLSVAGGSLDDLLGGALVSAFQDLAIKKNIFDDTDISRRTQELDDAVQTQFRLVFDALIDTVTEAATVLGFSMDEIQTALDQFQVYAQDISFEDLNAEEQQAELEAFFGRIFDRLAHEVVPFLSDFQQVGEGMGETLTRVATSVLVFDEGMKMLGFNIDNLLGTTFANAGDFRYKSTVIKVALVDLAGGLEQFIDQITGFFDAFATDEFKAAFLLESVETRFRELGLTLPDTREGIFNLMQSLDASTESGAAAIAMLLEITPLLDEYYSIIDEQERRRLQQAQMLNEYLGGPSSGLTALRNRFIEAMEAAKSLNATQREYAMIVRAFDRELQRFTAQLTINIIQQSQALFGSATQAAGDEFEQGFEGVRRVANSLFSEWQRAISNIRGFADDVLLDTNLTTLTPSQRLAESQSQFERLLAAARGGDIDAANALPDAARAYLEAARFMFASGEDYTNIFNNVQDALRGITMPDGIPEWTEETANNTARTAAAVEAMQNATVNELQRLLEAMTLSESLRDLGYALEQSPVELAQELGVPLDQLAEALGIDLNSVSRETVMGLVNMAELLGTDLDDLGAALGINIAGLADQFGIIFDAINFENRFLTQEDWLERIRDQLEETNTWLEIISGVRSGPGTVDPNIKDPSTPGGPGPTNPRDDTLTGATSDEGVKILTDIRDDNERYHRKMEDMNRRLLQVQEEVAAINRRAVA